jgi:hypothetical protein
MRQNTQHLCQGPSSNCTPSQQKCCCPESQQSGVSLPPQGTHTTLEYQTMRQDGMLSNQSSSTSRLTSVSWPAIWAPPFLPSQPLSSRPLQQPQSLLHRHATAACSAAQPHAARRSPGSVLLHFIVQVVHPVLQMLPRSSPGNNGCYERGLGFRRHRGTENLTRHSAGLGTAGCQHGKP